MVENESILAAIHVMTYQGERLLGNRWRQFVQHLRGQLQQAGIEEKDSSEALLLFAFAHPLSAMSNLFDCIKKAKKEFDWQHPPGKLPLQIIFHLPKTDDPYALVREATAEIWTLLKPEVPYITRSLKQKWDLYVTGKKAGDITLEDAGDGLFLVKIRNPKAILPEKLFQYRDLPLQGNQVPCFYCGMCNHVPAVCPSKLIPPEINAIDDVGYIPFNKLNEYHKKNFAILKNISEALATGIDKSLLKNRPNILAFIAYLDLYRVFQLRFLWKLAFSPVSKWKAIYEVDNFHSESRNLHLALDCLRVGKYAQADELFAAECAKKDGKHFYAYIGQAFVALEKGRVQDMGGHLDRAQSLAKSEKESIYNGLLLGRHYHLVGEYWKAKETIESLIKFYPDCDEALYMQIQIECGSGFNEKIANQLRNLISDNPKIFMTAMMDPALMPIQGFVEEMLTAKLQAIGQAAKEKFSKAKIDCENLRQWFDKGNEKLELNFQTLQNMEKQFIRKSYYDLVDLDSKAPGISMSCHSLKEESVNDLRRKIKKNISRYDSFQNFWKGFKYKYFFKGFSTKLRDSRKELKSAGKLAQEVDDPASYKKARDFEASAGAKLNELGHQLQKMVALQSSLNAIKEFSKKLLLSEALLIIAAIFSVPLIQSNFITSSHLKEMVREPLFQKQVLFIIALVIAPITAFTFTLWKLKDQKK